MLLTRRSAKRTGLLLREGIWNGGGLVDRWQGSTRVSDR